MKKKQKQTDLDKASEKENKDNWGEALFLEWIASVRSTISERCDQVTLRKITSLILEIRSGQFTHTLVGLIPEKVFDWIQQGRENHPRNTKLQEGLDSLEYGLYFEVIPGLQFNQIIGQSIKKYHPKNLEERNRTALIELRKVAIPKAQLAEPIGKDYAKGRVKRDDLSKKNWPMARNILFEIYYLLLTFA